MIVDGWAPKALRVQLIAELVDESLN